jgi:predicted membrane-bound dolichyl-phosphate-mannose-protein mannosyltransferase
MTFAGRATVKKIMIPIVFSVFLAVRIVVLFRPTPVIVAYGDAGYYISAGTAYVHGALPDSANPEHPPLAKYIIGLFNVYLGPPYYSSLLFGFLGVVVAFLISRKLTANGGWTAATVWLLSFDFVNISTSIYPVLDGFMVFFALLAIYFFMIAKKNCHYCLAGISLGAAVACKWTALFFAAPAVAVMFAERKYLQTSGAVLSATATYLLSYSRLIFAEGFGAFLRLQFWMMQFMISGHSPSSSALVVVHRFLDPLIFNLTTYGGLSGYNTLLHPEGFKLLGASYISFADVTNPLVMLLLIPVLYWYIRNRKFNESRENRLIFWALVSLVAWEILFFSTLELWFFAPVISVTCVAVSPALRILVEKGRKTRIAIYVYLGLVPLWFVFANAILALRIAHWASV